MAIGIWLQLRHRSYRHCKGCWIELIGTAVKVEAQELLLFGTITHCELKDGAYCVGIALSRPLEVLAELGKLNAALLGEPEPV
jgi:hypothetical protein